jgi:AcrR family transcriptional regulator
MKDIWIKQGYETFALAGRNELKVEPLAKAVGKSKSSFYHHFADIDLFIDVLMKHHIHQAHLIAAKERNASNINPDFINILVAHKIDLLFSRQLRINKHIPLFADTLASSNKITGDAFVKIWIKDLNIKLSPQQIEGVYGLALENFFLQINADNLHAAWLQSYFEQLNKLTNSLVPQPLYGAD